MCISLSPSALKAESLQTNVRLILIFPFFNCPNTCFRHAEDGCKKKYEPSEEDTKEMQKTNEVCVSQI